MTRTPSARAARAREQVAEVRDDPAARLELLRRTYARAPSRIGRYESAARAFMAWQVERGVLAPPHAARPGSPWWRAVNERLLADGAEALDPEVGDGQRPSSPSVAAWLRFRERPTPAAWYRAHNSTIVAGYLEHRELAEAETESERFFLNVALARVLLAHALVAAPRLALGRLRSLGPALGDPRRGTVRLFLSLGRVLPDFYPAERGVGEYIEGESGYGMVLDYGVLSPSAAALYSWSAGELAIPELRSLLDSGVPAYVWDDRRVWWPPRPSRRVALVRRALGTPDGRER